MDPALTAAASKQRARGGRTTEGDTEQNKTIHIFEHLLCIRQYATPFTCLSHFDPYSILGGKTATTHYTRKTPKPGGKGTCPKTKSQETTERGCEPSLSDTSPPCSWRTEIKQAGYTEGRRAPSQEDGEQANRNNAHCSSRVKTNQWPWLDGGGFVSSE